MTLPYPINTSIPASGNNPSADQPDMLANFQNINAFLGVDHAAPGSNNQAGQHNQTRFAINQTAPSLSSAVCQLFANNNQLFFNNASVTQQMTNLTISNVGTDYGISTPWGIIINWGTVANVPSTGSTVTFQVPFVTTNPSLSLTVENLAANADGSSASIKAISKTQFTAVCSTNHTLFYIAIGY